MVFKWKDEKALLLLQCCRNCPFSAMPMKFPNEKRLADDELPLP
jgi:hypothetical protein